MMSKPIQYVLLSCLVILQLFPLKASAQPTDYAVSTSTPSFCLGGSSASIDLAGSEVGVDYYLRNDANDALVAGPVAGTGSPISFNTGALYNSTTYNVYAEKASTALNFNSNQYVESNGLATFSNNFTIEAWVNPTSTHQIDAQSTSGFPGTGGQKYMLWPTFRGSEAGVGLSIGTNGISVYEHGASYMPSLLTWTGTISGWTHVAVVYVNKQPHLYINGVLVQTGLTSTKANCYPSLGQAGAFFSNVGGIGGGSYGYFDGSIDDFRIWSVSRTATEIQNNMTTCFSGTEANLYALYDFEDGTGSSTLSDLTGSHDGTLINMDPSSDWVSGSLSCGGLEMTDKLNINIGGYLLGTGTRGKMLQFDGSDDYVQLPDLDFSGSDEMTLELWLKPTDISTNSNYNIIRQEGATAGDYSWFLAFQGNGTSLSFRVRNTGGTAATLTHTITPANFENQWNHIAGVYDGTELRLYLNGVEVGTAVSQTGMVRHSSSSNTAIGALKVGASSVEYFEGAMDEVRFWNVGRSESEIRENMHLSLTDCSSGLLAYYQFDGDEDAGTAGGVKDVLSALDGTTVGNPSYNASEVAVGGGYSDRISINAAGAVQFPSAKVAMTFGATHPDGEIVLSRIKTQKPSGWSSTGDDVNNEYFIVHNYGTNSSFTALSDITFEDIGFIDPADAATPSVFNLYKRASNGFGNSWGSPLGTAVSATAGILGTLSFDGSSNITSFSQFALGTAPAQASALPIELLSFEADRLNDQEVSLKWATATELNNKGFYLERMLESENSFTVLTFVEGAGTTSEQQAYAYTDANAQPGVAYYRLRQVDFDGTESFSAIRAVAGPVQDFSEDIRLFPVPVEEQLNIRLAELPEGALRGQLRIVDLTGRVLVDRSVTLQSHQVLELNGLADWPAGLYLLQIEMSNGAVFARKFVKQ